WQPKLQARVNAISMVMGAIRSPFSQARTRSRCQAIFVPSRMRLRCSLPRDEDIGPAILTHRQLISYATSTRVRIDYKELVDYYNQSLVSQLRNFSMGHPFLEVWVPDDDLTKSLLGIFEAASAANITEEITIVLGNAETKGWSPNQLLRDGASWGELRI